MYAGVEAAAGAGGALSGLLHARRRRRGAARLLGGAPIAAADFQTSRISTPSMQQRIAAPTCSGCLTPHRRRLQSTLYVYCTSSKATLSSLLPVQHNPSVQKWMKAHNISDVRALEQYYVRRVLGLAASAGKGTRHFPVRVSVPCLCQNRLESIAKLQTQNV